ncbi:MAG: glycosyltransferase family 4 protein [Verrucomicrobia bacterium]|nr:glycosyltransferase family 4 protein [Verrucomicrobiota bacterium]MCH8513401.1 glycosyltransferase family 4 protein [Kiritimatiellia bacterium]
MRIDPRAPARLLLRARTVPWPDHSRLFLVEDRSSWVIHWEMRALADSAKRLGVRTATPFWMPHARRQSIFYGSQFFLLADDWLARDHRVATAYFHGKPGSGYPDFDRLYEQVRRHHERIHRLQVSHSEMENILLETGIAPEKLHRIPIGVDLSMFPFRTPERRLAARRELGIPEDAFVVGSFQKDGDGWGEGLAPKYIKGPDLLTDTLEILHKRVPKLHVLLSGPARGFVRNRLSRRGIPHTHRMLDHYPDIRGLYDALDAYLVSSRQEGGPKAVLESMACGVPLVTTRVGQAMDLVRDGENGFMTEVGDNEGLAERLEHVFRRSEDLAPMLSDARKTAEAHDYVQLDPLWKTCFDGFVTCGKSKENELRECKGKVDLDIDLNTLRKR